MSGLFFVCFIGPGTCLSFWLTAVFMFIGTSVAVALNCVALLLCL